MEAWLPFIGVMAGSTVLAGLVQQVIIWRANRKRNEAETQRAQAETESVQAQTIANQAEVENQRYTRLEDRYDRLENRYDRLEDELQQIRRNVYPHQQWDLLVHRKVLELDPDFPPPPDLLP